MRIRIAGQWTTFVQVSSSPEKLEQSSLPRLNEDIGVGVQYNCNYGLIP